MKIYFQSGFTVDSSAETVLLKIANYILTPISMFNITLLMLLDFNNINLTVYNLTQLTVKYYSTDLTIKSLIEYITQCNFVEIIFYFIY